VNAGLDRKRIEYTLKQLENLEAVSGEASSYSALVDDSAANAAVKELSQPAERGAGS
jgi:AICAR transformylase/IMP cyclohydrolase PurH